MRDLAAVADDLGIEYRIAGGQMVGLHVALAGNESGSMTPTVCVPPSRHEPRMIGQYSY
jgi:hypothetical protein